MTDATSTQARRVKHRALERALRDERTAITALAKVVLLECEDPTRALARIDAMVRAAENGQRLAPGARQAMIDAARFMRRAVASERKVEFDPPNPEPQMRVVDKLVAATDGPQQLGFVDHHESTLGDVEKAHEERVDTLTIVHQALVDILRDGDVMTDRQLYEVYLVRDHGAPRQSENALKERRRELQAAGLVTRAGDVRGATLYSLFEGA